MEERDNPVRAITLFRRMTAKGVELSSCCETNTVSFGTLPIVKSWLIARFVRDFCIFNKANLFLQKLKVVGFLLPNFTSLHRRELRKWLHFEGVKEFFGGYPLVSTSG